MKKSVILGAAIAVTTTVAYAQDISPPNCPPGYQCILVDPDAAAAAAKSDQGKCPPGYQLDGKDNCVLTDLDAAAQGTRAREEAEQAEQRNKETDTDGQVAGPGEVSIGQCKEGGFDPNTGGDNCLVTNLAGAQARPAVRAQQEQGNKETDTNGQVAGPSEVPIEQDQRLVGGGFDPNTGR